MKRADCADTFNNITEMKKLTSLLLIAALVSVNIQAAKTKLPDGEIIKTGWNFGPMPVVGFDSDLGFQYGICCDIFNYGNGSDYPSYDFKINVEASTYTKGSSILRSYGYFNKLIDEGKLFYDVTFLNSPKYDFFGYNGFASPYYKDHIEGHPRPDAKSGYYLMHRKQFRVVTSMMKNITGNLNWAVGLAYYHINTDPIDTCKYDIYAGQTTLYDKYCSAGLIGYKERGGGNVIQFRAGLVYDSRDRENDPTRGFNVELSFAGAPDFIDNEGHSYLTFDFVGSQFVPVVSDKLTFAYRIGLQTNLTGDMPYYMTNNLNTMFFRKLYTEILGGNASVRGINHNGVVGDGVGWLNLEFRWRAIGFKFINQNWDIVFNPFFDAGQVIQSYKLDEQKHFGDDLCIALVPGENGYSYCKRLYSGENESPHCSAGVGLKLIMNHNLVVSVEAAKALNKKDGERLWTNIGFNYIF